MEEYRDFVRDTGLTDVVFKGFVSDEDKIRYYQQCDVYCSPAVGRESQGVVLLEAMAAGRPVIASALDGYRTVVRHEQDGLLVPPADETALAVGLCRLLSDAALRRRLAEAGHAKVQAYSWEKVARRLLDVYDEAIAEFRRRNPAELPLPRPHRPPRVGPPPRPRPPRSPAYFKHRRTDAQPRAADARHSPGDGEVT